MLIAIAGFAGEQGDNAVLRLALKVADDGQAVTSQAINARINVTNEAFRKLQQKVRILHNVERLVSAYAHFN
jgi:hypothetical protein